MVGLMRMMTLNFYFCIVVIQMIVEYNRTQNIYLVIKAGTLHEVPRSQPFKFESRHILQIGQQITQCVLSKCGQFMAFTTRQRLFVYEFDHKYNLKWDKQIESEIISMEFFNRNDTKIEVLTCDNKGRLISYNESGAKSQLLTEGVLTFRCCPDCKILFMKDKKVFEGTFKLAGENIKMEYNIALKSVNLKDVKPLALFRNTNGIYLFGQNSQHRLFVQNINNQGLLTQKRDMALRQDSKIIIKMEQQYFVIIIDNQLRVYDSGYNLVRSVSTKLCILNAFIFEQKIEYCEAMLQATQLKWEECQLKLPQIDNEATNKQLVQQYLLQFKTQAEQYLNQPQNPAYIQGFQNLKDYSKALELGSHIVKSIKSRAAELDCYALKTQSERSLNQVIKVLQQFYESDLSCNHNKIELYIQHYTDTINSKCKQSMKKTNEEQQVDIFLRINQKCTYKYQDSTKHHHNILDIPFYEIRSLIEDPSTIHLQPF